MAILEQSLDEKAQTTIKYESRIAELVEQYEKQRSTYEATLADMDGVLEKTMNRNRDLEQQVSAHSKYFKCFDTVVSVTLRKSVIIDPEYYC